MQQEQGKSLRESGVYKPVNDHFEQIFNAVIANVIVFTRAVKRDINLPIFLHMIPDKPLKTVIIPFFAASLWIPLWGFANPEMATGEDQENHATAMTLERPQDTAATPPGINTANTTAMVITPPSPHISSLELPPGALGFTPLNHLFFDHNKATLNQSSKSILDEAAQFILQSDNIDRVIIHGHASNIASQAYNDRLSDKRAFAVRDYLIKKNIPADLMWVMGWGEEDPIDENWTRAGRQRNRHVEIYLIQHTPAQ